jgi:hypothetical protein
VFVVVVVVVGWGGGGAGLRRRKRYGLVEYRALPGYLRDNEYIHRHYRCEWPLPQVLLSAFSIHNETLNVWTYVTPSPFSALFLSQQLSGPIGVLAASLGGEGRT